MQRAIQTLILVTITQTTLTFSLLTDHKDSGRWQSQTRGDHIGIDDLITKTSIRTKPGLVIGKVI